MKITIVGSGYVGLSLSLLLAQKNEVIALDIDEEKVKLLEQKISPIQDEELSFYLKKDLNFKASLNIDIFEFFQIIFQAQFYAQSHQIIENCQSLN